MPVARTISPTRLLTLRYILALSSVALLTLLGQVIIQWTLQQQSSDALVINIAGRQRMLSQRLSKAALELEVFPDASRRLHSAQELRDVAALWQRCQEGLQYGDPELGLPGQNSPTIQRLFKAIQPEYTEMLHAARQLVALALVADAQASTVPASQFLPFIQTILTAQADFLAGMDAIVTQYQLEAQDHVTQQSIREFLLLGLTLLVLLLEGLLVFRPAVRRLRQTIADLLQANERLFRAEITRKRAERVLALNEALAASHTSTPHARIIALHHYQVRDKEGTYYNVHHQEVEGREVFACECPQYQAQAICSHSLTAAVLHSTAGLQTS